MEINAFEFCRLQESRRGELALSDLARLREELVDVEGSLRWFVQGGKHDAGYPQLLLAVEAIVQLRCQRCLSAMPFQIASESVLVLARDERGADEIEAILDDDSVDVIVGSASLDVLVLVEDEALLALPQAPRHAVCPEQQGVQQAAPAAAQARNQAEQQAAQEKLSPFAALKDLKRRN